MKKRILNQVKGLIIKDYPLIVKKNEKNKYFKNVVIPKVIATKMLYIHVPKTAGSSIQNGLFDLNSWTHHRYIDFENEIQDELLNSFYKFSFVRNPYSRLYSAYKYLKLGGTNRTDKYWAKKYLSRYNSFEYFVKKFVSENNIYSYVHFVPQFEFLINKNREIVLDFIGRYENINADFQSLVKILGVKTALPKRNITKDETRDFFKQYDNEMKEIVANVYALDFKYFNYDREVR